MGHQKKSEKRLGYSHLRLATIDGVSLPGLQLSLDRKEGSASTKKPFSNNCSSILLSVASYFIRSSYMNIPQRGRGDKGAKLLSESYDI